MYSANEPASGAWVPGARRAVEAGCSPRTRAQPGSTLPALPLQAVGLPFSSGAIPRKARVDVTDTSLFLSVPPSASKFSAEVLRARELRVGGEESGLSGRRARGERKNFLPVGTLACHHPRSVTNIVVVRLHRQWVESSRADPLARSTGTPRGAAVRA